MIQKSKGKGYQGFWGYTLERMEFHKIEVGKGFLASESWSNHDLLLVTSSLLTLFYLVFCPLPRCLVNSFVPNAPLLYPPENIRKQYGCLMFSGGERKGTLGTNGLIRITPFGQIFLYIITRLKLYLYPHCIFCFTHLCITNNITAIQKYNGVQLS